VITSNPRMLVVVVDTQIMTSKVISAHAPTLEASQQRRKDFYDRLLPHMDGQIPTYLFIDANARASLITGGDNHAGVDNRLKKAAIQFAQFVEGSAVAIPPLHGQSLIAPTYKLSTTAATIDYIGFSAAAYPHLQAYNVGHQIVNTFEYEDHVPVVSSVAFLACKLSTEHIFRWPRLDIRKLSDPKTFALLDKRLKALPPIQWTCDVDSPLPSCQ